MLLQQSDAVNSRSAADVEKFVDALHRNAFGQRRRDVFRSSGQRQRKMPSQGFLLHRRFDAVAIDERRSLIVVRARRSIGAQTLDHLQDAGTGRRQADVIADVERAALRRARQAYLGNGSFGLEQDFIRAARELGWSLSSVGGLMHDAPRCGAPECHGSPCGRSNDDSGRSSRRSPARQGPAPIREHPSQ